MEVNLAEKFSFLGSRAVRVALRHSWVFFFFLAALSLHYCSKAFCSCSERGCSLLAVQGFPIAAASLVAEYML